MPKDNDHHIYKAQNQGIQFDVAKIIAQYQMQTESVNTRQEHLAQSETRRENPLSSGNEKSAASGKFVRKFDPPVKSFNEILVPKAVLSKNPVTKSFNQSTTCNNRCDDESGAPKSTKTDRQMKKRNSPPPKLAKRQKDALHATMLLSTEQTRSSALNQSSKLQANVNEVPKPKRPLSAYNIFFRDHRLKLLQQQKSNEDDSKIPPNLLSQPINGKKATPKDASNEKKHKKIGFSQLAKSVSTKWKTIDPDLRAYYKSQAQLDLERYQKEMDRFNEAKMEALSQARLQLEMTVDSDTKKRYLQAEQSKKGSRRKK